MTIVDAHHHVFNPAVRDYPWMVGPTARLRRHRTVDELRGEATAAGVHRTVLVQTIADLAETRDFLALSDASAGFISGVVGWVDLTAPDLADTVAWLRALPGGHRLVGVRHQVHDEPDPDWLLRPDVLHGMETLAEHGLVHDLLVRPRELPAALRAARTIESLRFVVDHAAKPDIANRVIHPWAARLAELAALPNVTCKLSGLVTEANWETWTPHDLQPYITELLNLFGPERLLFGSDWPVCTLAGSYSQVIHATRDCLTALSDAETAAVFGTNAREIYRI